MGPKPIPAEDVIGVYTRHAADWIETRGHQIDLEQKWLDAFTSLIKPFGRILDVGCGSGYPIAHYLIETGLILSGVDASAPLIEVCRQNFPENSWLLGDMRTFDFQREFDGLIAWDSLFHLTPDDQRLMFPLFRKHAAPQAVLLFTSGPSHGELIGEFCGEDLYHASLDADEYSSLLQANGFAVVDHEIEDRECGGHTVWLAQLLH